MLADLEPSTQVTGGTWYTEGGEYDVGFIKILHHQCYKRIKEKRYCSIKALVEWIAASEISNVPLYEPDIQDIVHTLVYDGLIEEVEDLGGTHGGDVLYKAVEGYLPGDSPLAQLPCGACPVFDQCGCTPSSVISPHTCPYLTDWTAMF
eukprot:TRINITY_DN2058_c0_g1_i2.p2 TRINITY_DN2058_c0_g1~~TRINITY_DN2058_c0_g1_i2.p2  ORF type:complete len:149 (+),score=60.96 TRINITY_DN2058_c0_g1_i2:119-565(+)